MLLCQKEVLQGSAATKRIGISPSKTQRPQRKGNIIFYPNLAFFAPWREEYPNPRCSCIGNLHKLFMLKLFFFVTFVCFVVDASPQETKKRQKRKGA